MSDTSVRINKELYDFVKQIADNNNKSVKDIVEQAILIAYKNTKLEGGKDIKNVKSAIITTKYSSKCSVCGSTINEGTLAYWIKYEFTDNTINSKIICLDCYYGDTALAKHYMKKKELEITIKGLKKIADSLVQQISKLQTDINIAYIKRDIFTIYSDFKRLLKEQDLSKIEEVIIKLNEALEKISQLESAIKTKLRVEKEKKKILEQV